MTAPDSSAPTAGAYLGGLLAALVAAVRENADWFRQSHDEEALHQLRISVRRLRAASAFARPIASREDGITGANDRLRTLAEPFGEVRDLDVIGAAIAEAGGGIVLPADAEALAAALADRRREVARESEEVLASAAWAEELDRIETAALGGPWRETPAGREPAWHAVSHGLDSWWWDLTAAWQDLAALSPHQRHRVRITAKKLRYLTELTADLYADREGERASSSAGFKEVQDHLGEMQDRVAGAALVRDHGFRPASLDASADAAALTRVVAVACRLESHPPYWRARSE